MRDRILQSVVIAFFLVVIPSITSGVQSIDGTTGYALSPSVELLNKGKVSMSVWANYVNSRDFKNAGIFPVSFATGISSRSELFLSFSETEDLDPITKGVSLGFKLLGYKGDGIFPSAGLVLRTTNITNMPDGGISVVLEKNMGAGLTLVLNGGYVVGIERVSGFTGDAGVVYGRIYPKTILGVKTEKNFRRNTIYLSGLLKLIEKMYLTILTGYTTDEDKYLSVFAGITYSTEEPEGRVIPEVKREELMPPEEKKPTFPDPVPKFRLKINRM